jgi:hypothetical protein
MANDKSTPNKLTKNEVIKLAMSFPMKDVLTKYCKEYALPLDLAKEHEREIKRFLILCALYPKTKYMMRGPIDHIWHTFILFTEKYTLFCNQIANRYIHHFPSLPPEHRKPAIKPGDTKPERNTYSQFTLDYKETFNEDPPIEFWPKPRNLKNKITTAEDACMTVCEECGCMPADTCYA